jgi:bifunctional non-homologous end joining protein LigD
MAGSLSTYWKKRDFKVTAEPRGEVARAGKQLSFVIQKHAGLAAALRLPPRARGTLKELGGAQGPEPRSRA